MKHTQEELTQWRSLPLDVKIDMSIQRIRDWYNYWDGMVYVSFSGGKDSTVLKHLVESIYPDVPSVFVNTGLEFPEIQKFAMSQPNVQAVRPSINFKEVIEKYGYPVISKEISETVKEARINPESRSYKKLQGELTYQGKKSPYNMDKYSYLYDAPFNMSAYCCAVMKKNPSKIYERSTKRKAIVGSMTEESLFRKKRWMQEGCNAFENKRPVSMPLAFWTEQDILHYLVKFNVPYCQVYGDIKYKALKEDFYQMYFYDFGLPYTEDCSLKTTGRDRTGCVFCMFGCHLEKEPNRFQKLKKTHPRLYEYCVGGGQLVEGKWMPSKEGLGLGKVLDYIGVKY